MPKLLPDQSFYPSPTMAMQAPAETVAYVALLNPDATANDALAVLDVDPASPGYGAQIARVDMPLAGDELHHFGWNACSSCLCPNSPHAHMQRRYLVVPGMRSSRIHILDTAPDPRQPRLVKVIDAEEIVRKTGYSRPHTVHCGPDGIYVNALGNAAGDGPGGIFVLDPETFEIKGKWEKDRGPQQLSYDFWWHLGHDTMITSEWGTPKMVENGVIPELLLGGKYGNSLHVWDLNNRRHLQRLELGPEQQMVLELRPAHDPNETYGFAGVVTSLKDLSGSIWMWYREGTDRNGTWRIRKVIEIPAEPAAADDLPPLFKGFGAAPPLITDINLSLDDRFLYVSCFGTGELKQYRRLRSLQPGRDRLGEDRGHGPPPAAPGATRPAAERRTADGRDQPRRQASLPDQLSVSDVGRPVLSRRHQGLARQSGCACERWHRLRSCRIRGFRSHASSPGPSRRRRREFRFVLLLLRRNQESGIGIQGWARLRARARPVGLGPGPALTPDS